MRAPGIGRRGNVATGARFGERGGLDGGADGDDFVGVDAIEGWAPEELLDATAHEGDARRPAYEDDFVERAPGETSDREGLLANGKGAFDEGSGECIELAPGHAEGKVEVGATEAERDVLQGELGVVGGGELQLQVLGPDEELLEGLRVGPRIGPVCAEERLGDPFGDGGVEVVASEKGIAGGGQDFEDGARELQESAVERASAEVVHGDALVLGAAQSVGEGRGRGLVDDAQHVEAGDAAGDLRGGALKLVEVSGDGDDGAVDRLAKPAFRDRACPFEDERADLGERVLVASDDDEGPVRRALLQLERVPVLGALDFVAVPRSPDEALDAGDRVLGVDDAPIFRLLPDEDVAVRGKDTTLGRRRRPSASASTRTFPARAWATTVLVVPRSIPTTAIVFPCSCP